MKKSILKLFFIKIRHFKENTINKNYDILWEIMFNIEYLIQFLKNQYIWLKNNIIAVYLTIFVIMALDKLKNYLDKTNQSAV